MEEEELKSDIQFLNYTNRYHDEVETGGMDIANQNTSMQTAMNFGSYLTVMAVEARNLAPLDIEGTSDPYAIFMLEDKVN